MTAQTAKAEKAEYLHVAMRAISVYTQQSSEDRLFWTFLLLSGFAHLVFLNIPDFSWLRKPTPLVDEWAIDADLIAESNLSDKDALPKAEKAEEIKIPDNLLPQLPKKFAIKENAEPDEGLADPDKTIPQETAKEEPKPPEPEKIKVKSDPDEQNLLENSDALKRAALELLRKQAIKDKQAQAAEEDPIARLGNEMFKKKQIAGGVSAEQRQLYRSNLQRAVRRNYALPEAYNLKDANLSVVIEIVLSERGNLLKSEVTKSSGDSVFDELALKAVKNSAPMPTPPRGLVGEPINLQFTPRSF